MADETTALRQLRADMAREMRLASMHPGDEVQAAIARNARAAYQAAKAVDRIDRALDALDALDLDDDTRSSILGRIAEAFAAAAVA